MAGGRVPGPLGIHHHRRGAVHHHPAVHHPPRTPAPHQPPEHVQRWPSPIGLLSWTLQHELEALPVLDFLLNWFFIFWGVDSASAANTHVGGRQTLFDYVKKRTGRAPSFWGRYIGGAFSLTASEAAFLHDPNHECKILVIYNGAHDSSKSVRGGHAEGVSDAKKAIDAAGKLGVPPLTFIYADIETSWHPAAKWFEGWSDTMLDSHYGGSGGVYANPLPHNNTRFNQPYCQAYSHDAKMRDSILRLGSYIYSSEPEPGCGIALRAPSYKPAAPPCNPHAVVWQYAEGCLGGWVDEDLADLRGFWSMW